VQWLVTSPEDLAVLVEINRGASDRALAIVAASLIEIHLTKLIKQALIDNAKVEQMLFRSSGPLGAFATKIRLAYMMGMISPEFFKDLEIMREIRNRFAHDTHVGSFDIPEIYRRCLNFTIVEKYAGRSAQRTSWRPFRTICLTELWSSRKTEKSQRTLFVECPSIFDRHSTCHRCCQAIHSCILEHLLPGVI
jgi:DNA-binding MltR family transcriptional regulator